MSANEKVGDLVEEIVGNFGTWQLIIILAGSLTKLTVAWHLFAIIFLAPPQAFWCARPPEFANISVDLWKNISSPDVKRACQRYNFTADDLSIPGFVPSSAGTIPCTDWEFDTQIFETTIISQWNLVCDREYLQHIAQTVYMFGILIGSLLIGIISDKIGRKLSLMGSVILQILVGTATAFCSNLYIFMAMRCLDGVATCGLMITSYVICMEVLGKKWRAPIAVIYHIPISLGHSFLAGVAYFIRDWKYFQLAISVPSIAFITYFWLIPESPRWLLSVGRFKEAEKIFKKAAKRNNMPVSNINELIQNRAQDRPLTTKTASFLDLFKNRSLRIKTLCITSNWIVCGCCFYGLAQYIGQIDSNIFVNVAWSGVIQIPGTFVCAYTNQKWGRKKTLMTSYCITAVACLLIIAIPKDITWPTVALAMTGLISMSAAFSSVYLFSGELFPTVVRNAGIGLSSTCARFGSMVAPFISGMGSFSPILPPVIFGILPIIGCLLCLFLPETMGIVLPDTVDDGDNSDEDRKPTAKFS